MACPAEGIVVLIVWLASFFLFGLVLSSILSVDYESVGNGTIRFTNVIFTIEQTKESVSVRVINQSISTNLCLLTQPIN